jgi:hypothetical protein
LPCAATALAQMWGNARLVDPLEITSAKIDIACLQHALFVGVSRPRHFCERQYQLKDLVDQHLHPGSEQMARLKCSTCVQDRLRLSEALWLADNSHRIRSVVAGRARLRSDCGPANF